MKLPKFNGFVVKHMADAIHKEEKKLAEALFLGDFPDSTDPDYKEFVQWREKQWQDCFNDLVLFGEYVVVHLTFDQWKKKYKTVQFTDWDAECELLNEWLEYWINHPRHTSVILNGELLRYHSPEHLLRMIREQGILFVDAVDGFHETKPLPFEMWREIKNKRSLHIKR